MSVKIYTSLSKPSFAKCINPYTVITDLWQYREMILSFANRDFNASHRGTLLGALWSIVSPLIMLAVFTFVFGFIFRGRFNIEIQETPLEYAIALFVGISFFNCIGQALGTAPSIIAANASYVKTGLFPLEILPLAATIHMSYNFLISLGLCFTAFFLSHGYLHLSSLVVLPLMISIILLALGITWLLSSVSVFIRDVAAIVPPMTLVLMFMSSVFFPINFVPEQVRWVVLINPIASIIDQARTCFVYGSAPNFLVIAIVFVVSFFIALFGYAVFVRSKPAFADLV
jgi:lipopolysaccharide transport system permease protein